jgi:long-subunit acyl-CoA synthetase (AMP-forming)
MINQIAIILNSNYSFVVAVVHLKEDKLKQFADVNGFKEELKDLIKLHDVEYGVLKQLERAANVHQLSPIEVVKRVVITAEPFSF